MIVIDHLTLRTAERLLIDRLQLTLAVGQRWAILGPNGAGKTTLLRTLAGLQTASAGEIQLDGQTLARVGAEQLALKRAYLAQDHGDVFGLSVAETVMLGRHPHGGDWDSPDDVARVNDALARLDLSPLARRDVRTLSGGERQRVALALVLAQDTPLLLLDEPSNHLDIAHQRLLLDTLRANPARLILASLHDPNLARALATHALLLLPAGRWLAGPAATVLTAEHLSCCLGHPIDDVAGCFRPQF